jgi:uncharacterized short protein YbdD (DUF466 family)
MTHPQSLPASTRAHASALRRAARLLARAAWVVRRLIGAPDYDRYAAHMRACHPHAPLLSRDAFGRDVLARRYERPGSRCC